MPMPTRGMLLGGLVLMALLRTGAHATAQEPDRTVTMPAETEVPQTVSEAPGSPTAKTQTHISLFVLGTRPFDETLKVGGASVSNAELKRSFGGGLKVGAFPKFGNGYFGVEGEMFGHSGRLTAPSSGQSEAAGNLVTYNLMANVLLRYPGSVLQPYVGVGAGQSLGYLNADNIRVGTVRVQGKSAEFALAYQLLGGLRAYVSDRAFVFGEYRYFGAKYKWGDSLFGSVGDTSLRLHTHIVAVGLGFSL